MKTLQLRFRNAALDVTIEDGLIYRIDQNGRNITTLMFDLELTGEILTLALEEIAQKEREGISDFLGEDLQEQFNGITIRT